MNLVAKVLQKIILTITIAAQFLNTHLNRRAKAENVIAWIHKARAFLKIASAVNQAALTH